MSRQVVWILALAFPAFSQEGPASADRLTLKEALKILKECGTLMDQAEELLNDAALGKEIETDAELIEKIDRLLKEEGSEPPPEGGDPAESQEKVLKKITRLMERSGGSQGQVVDKLGGLIRRAMEEQKRQQPQPGSRPPQPQPQPKSPKPGSEGKGPAPAPYDPNRADPVNKFRSKADRSGRWGDLPPRIREAMLSGRRRIDEFPSEYQQLLKEYMKALSEESE